MKHLIECDRRRFVQMMGSTLFLSAVGNRLSWATSSTAARFAYIGSEHEIHVYAITTDGSFVKQQAIASAHPTAMAIRNGNLYVANGISEYDNLPRGSVEAYAIDAASGKLKLKNRVPLSLSATIPRDLAVAPDGRSVVVAVHGGGAYNLLPLFEDGRLGRVSAILKETGSGPHALQTSAHPSVVMFDRAGRLLAADLGSDRLNVLSLRDNELTVSNRREVAAGSGPSDMVLHSPGKRLYVAHALNGSVSSFAYDGTLGRILDRKQTVQTLACETVALAMHPSGETLYSSHGDGVSVWKIDANGYLKDLPGVEGVPTNKLYVLPDGNCLLALSNDAVLRMKIDTATGKLATPVKVASLSKPASIATL
jgi:6-phosphogluconolactonase